jgi:uncharacterized membrane protein (UPF0127 family)
MQRSSGAKRFAGLPVVAIAGLEVPVAVGPRARLLGLAHLDREEAEPGLLIPRCRSVHTFGMRFALDLFFLDADGEVLELRHGARPRRLVWAQSGAVAVLELPSRGRDSGALD